MFKRVEHWNNIYETKSPSEVSWTEDYPTYSIEFIESLNLDKSLPIIDIGAGDSRVVDSLIELGFNDITVLDISENALNRAKQRLGKISSKIDWISSDILNFRPKKTYNLWHDRACFHFLTKKEDIDYYKNIVRQNVTNHLLICTFSDTGPLKCSGLQVTRYSCEKIKKNFEDSFKLTNCKLKIHKTPFNTEQSFIYSSFRRKIN
tara:strand:+ start:272 stop:886 length:615 start_codon:yes stop_codon:yes gene_type:complete